MTVGTGDTSFGRSPHVPVLLRPLLAAVAPVTGVWLDGTFGAGGYARGLLAAGAAKVIGIDRDPLALQLAAGWAADYGDRLRLVQGNFSDLGEHGPLDGIVLDLGEARDISSVEVQFAEPGASLELRVPTERDLSSAPMTTQSEWEAVSSQAQADATVTLTPSEPTNSRFLLVYLTELPEVTTARYQSEITNIVVNG